jgi:chromosome segregation ATPase
MALGAFNESGDLRPIRLWSLTRSSAPDPESKTHWKLGQMPLRSSTEDYRHHMEQTRSALNDLEATKARLEVELSEVTKTVRSLQEDLNNFSTFEQICNSGMLRNFKIDSESEFAQVILKLLQRTMELQISHLQQKVEDPDHGTETAEYRQPFSGWNTNPGVTEP